MFFSKNNVIYHNTCTYISQKPYSLVKKIMLKYDFFILRPIFDVNFTKIISLIKQSINYFIQDLGKFLESVHNI